jgi:hypothetical protein
MADIGTRKGRTRATFPAHERSTHVRARHRVACVREVGALGRRRAEGERARVAACLLREVLLRAPAWSIGMPSVVRNASPNSIAFWKRSFGDFASDFATSISSSIGACGRYLRSGGGGVCT